jgi:hypothetical protein
VRAGSSVGPPHRVLPMLAVVLAATAGCGFLDEVAHPQASDTGSSIATGVAAPATPSPEPPPAVVDADLLTPSGAAGGHLAVTLGPARTGLAPPVLNTEGCHFDAPSLEYVPVVFTPSPGLAAHVEISTGPATPADIGDVGIFVESNSGEQVYCTDYPPLPTRDKFFNQMGARTITAWVVLDHAVTPATPAGRPEVFPTLQLRISDFRLLSDPTAGRTLVPGPLGRGAVCSDNADAICVPLG